MSHASDPDRLERFAMYVMDEPPNVPLWQVADSLNDAAARIRRLQRWKVEALPLLEQLGRCHALLPPSAQAQLGGSMGDAVEKYIRRVTPETVAVDTKPIIGPGEYVGRHGGDAA